LGGLLKNTNIEEEGKGSDLRRNGTSGKVNRKDQTLIVDTPQERGEGGEPWDEKDQES